MLSTLTHVIESRMSIAAVTIRRLKTADLILVPNSLEGIRRELQDPKGFLAAVWALLLLRPYTEGSQFTIRKDHSALRWSLKLSEATGRLGIWQLRLTEFDLDVVFLAGIIHKAADELSRLPKAD